LKVITWNVNSVKQRLPRLVALLGRHEPDIVCLQETKVEDEGFPFDEVRAAGYEAVSFGQRAYNGVAILSRSSIADVTRGFAEDPTPEESRVLSARTAGLGVMNVYVVNGKEVGNPSYEVKLRWLEALAAHIEIACDPADPMIVCGDFNVAPDDRDVWDPEGWRGQNLASEPERERVRALMGWGLVDVVRASAGDVAGPWTYWDYRAGAFHKGWGLRIDLVLATKVVADRVTEVFVDRNERKPTAGEGKPSDHAPLVVTVS
jgi:exodeoxyribonuclease III